MYKYIIIKKIIVSQNISSNYESMKNDISNNIRRDCECYNKNKKLIVCKNCNYYNYKKYKN